MYLTLALKSTLHSIFKFEKKGFHISVVFRVLKKLPCPNYFSNHLSYNSEQKRAKILLSSNFTFSGEKEKMYI